MKKVLATLVVMFAFAPMNARAESVPAVYESLKKSPDDAGIWFQYGTLSAESEDYGEARWALENARLRAPFFGDAAHNLDVVEQIVRIQSIEASRTGRTLEGDETLFWWRFFTSVPAWFFGLSMVLSWLLVLALITALRRNHEPSARRDALFVGWITCVLFGVVLTTLCAIRESVIESTTPVVVKKAGLELREGPSKLANRVRTEPNVVPGVVLRVVDTRPDWVKVQFPDGRSAWASPVDVLEISLSADTLNN